VTATPSGRKAHYSQEERERILSWMTIPHPSRGNNYNWTSRVPKAQWTAQLLAWDKEEGTPIFNSSRTSASMNEFWTRWLKQYKERKRHENGTGNGKLGAPKCHNFDQIDALVCSRMNFNPGAILDGDPSIDMIEEAIKDTNCGQDNEATTKCPLRRFRLASISSDIDEIIIDPLDIFLEDPLSKTNRSVSPRPPNQESLPLSSIATSSQETPKGPERKRKLKRGHDSFLAHTMQDALASKAEISNQREERLRIRWEAERELQRERLAFERQEAEDRRERERRDADERRIEKEEQRERDKIDREERRTQNELMLKLILKIMEKE
jgi:hypothetical protein